MHTNLLLVIVSIQVANVAYDRPLLKVFNSGIPWMS